MKKATWLALGLSMTAMASAAMAQAPAPAAAAKPAEAPYTPPAKRISPGEAPAAWQGMGPTPHRADAHVDLTGVWNGTPSWGAPQHELRHPGTLEADQMVPQRGSQWNKPLYKPEFWQKVRDLDYSRIDVDPSYACTPLGVPRAGVPARGPSKSRSSSASEASSSEASPLPMRVTRTSAGFAAFPWAGTVYFAR